MTTATPTRFTTMKATAREALEYLKGTSMDLLGSLLTLERATPRPADFDRRFADAHLRLAMNDLELLPLEGGVPMVNRMEIADRHVELALAYFKPAGETDTTALMKACLALALRVRIYAVERNTDEAWAYFFAVVETIRECKFVLVQPAADMPPIEELPEPTDAQLDVADTEEAWDSRLGDLINSAMLSAAADLSGLLIRNGGFDTALQVVTEYAQAVRQNSPEAVTLV